MLAGLLLGAVLPFIFSAVTMRAVGKAAFEVVNEVRRQFLEIPGIMDGTAKPEYGRCVDYRHKSCTPGNSNARFSFHICALAGRILLRSESPCRASIVGDTVGDPFKDTAGPALNALIKFVNLRKSR